MADTADSLSLSDRARPLISDSIDQANEALYKANQAIHANPELGYQEFFAHDTLCDLLEAQGYAVTRKAHGLDTSFEAQIGSGGREVVICAEYDALPEIGHACGHNLIATSSMAAFLGAARAKSDLNLPGRLRILGTPAEEGAGGKIKLIRAGAFTGASAAIMAHGITSHGISDTDAEVTGLAALDLIASLKFRVEFRGRSAHAAGEPWNGVNALDAAVAAYNNVSLLRQQIHPDERVHGVFEAAGTVPNVITDYTRMNWYIRSPTVARGEKLRARVEACLDAGAKAAGCQITYINADDYKNVVSNQTLCQIYAEEMGVLGEKVLVSQEKPFTASTDMGNVSHEVPGFHGAFAIPTTPDTALHSTKFATAAGTKEAHDAAIKCAKGMALMAIRVLADDEVAAQVKHHFETNPQLAGSA